MPTYQNNSSITLRVLNTKGDSQVVSYGHSVQTYKFLEEYALLEDPGLLEDDVNDAKVEINSEFDFMVAGVKYTKAATANIAFTVTDPIKQNLWGAFRFLINASGTVSMQNSPLTGGKQQYVSKATALAALADVVVLGGECVIGELAVQAKAGGDWTPGTDDLTADAESFEWQIITLGVQGLTKTSDYPLWNPVAKMNNIIFSGADNDQTITLSRETHSVRLQKVSTGLLVDAYLHEKNTAEPVIFAHGEDDLPLDITINNRALKVVLDPDAAGTCQLVELRKE